MKREDGMSYRQYLAAAGVSLFSPVTRLLPKAVLERAGFSGWLAPLPALLPLLGLLWLTGRLLTVDGRKVGLADALLARLGPWAGRIVGTVLALWLLFYGGVILRAGSERILSTVYPTAGLPLFLGGGLLLALVFALGRIRWAGRSAFLTLLFFGGILAVVFAAALPALHGDYLWPPELSRWPGLCRAALPVADALSPWVWFSFLRGSVTEDEGSFPRALRGLFCLCLLTTVFLMTTIGDLGPELALRQQFPFYVMIKNLHLLNVMERFDGVIVALWMMTDYVFVGMLLLSASVGFQRLSGSRRRETWVLFCAAGMLLSAVFGAGDAFRFAWISERLAPSVNLCLAFLLLPLIALFPPKKENLQFSKKGVDKRRR